MIRYVTFAVCYVMFIQTFQIIRLLNGYRTRTTAIFNWLVPKARVIARRCSPRAIALGEGQTKNSFARIPYAFYYTDNYICLHEITLEFSTLISIRVNRYDDTDSAIIASHLSSHVVIDCISLDGMTQAVNIFCLAI